MVAESQAVLFGLDGVRLSRGASFQRAVLRARRISARAAVVAGLTLALVETMARLAPPGRLSHEQLLRGGDAEKALVQPHPYLSYALTSGWRGPGTRHNALGFRGPEITAEKPAGTLRVLCLGGSSTYGFSVSSDAATWPARLQARLQDSHPYRRIEVINAGVPGYTSFENLASFEFRGLDLRPDIVVSYAGYNDLRAATWPSPRGDNTQFRKSWTAPSRDRLTSVLECSRTFLLLRWFLTDFRARTTELASYVVVDEGPVPTLDRRRAMSAIAVRAYQRNLASLVGAARSHGVKVLLAPEGYGEATIGPDIAGLVGDGMFALAECVRGLAAREAAAGDVALFDAPRSLPIVPGVFSEGVHLTDAGADRLAALVAARLGELRWVGPR